MYQLVVYICNTSSPRPAPDKPCRNFASVDSFRVGILSDFPFVYCPRVSGSAATFPTNDLYTIEK